MSGEKLKFESVVKIFEYIQQHPGENRNNVQKEVEKLGVSSLQFDMAEDSLYDKCLINEGKIPSGIGYTAKEGITREILEKCFS